MKKRFLYLVLILFVCAAVFEGACILFGADNVYMFCVGMTLVIGLPLLATSKKPQSYWDRRYKTYKN